MTWSESLRGLSTAQRRHRIRVTIEQVGALCEEFAPGHTITSASIPGLLSPSQQIVVFAALALADGSPVCLVCPAEPLYDEGDRDLWWRALDTLGGPQRTIALFSLPPARALSPVSITTTTVDISESETVVAS
jgi:hypothetical protein